MAKKWKAYPWSEEGPIIQEEEDEEIDVVGDAPSGHLPSSWAPSSPTAAATAPSPPPHQTDNRIPILYNGKSSHLLLS
jgi:hypothetical protein